MTALADDIKRLLEDEFIPEDYRNSVRALVELVAEMQEALESCYDVVEWPCDGGTRQDDAIRKAAPIAALAKGE